MEGSETFFGLLESLGAVLLFGSMFLPIKVMHIDTGDGVYAHFIMCIGALITSFVVYVFEGFPPFFPYAMLGGALWGINII
ncbi:transmembrane family of transporters domain-containing protein [Ditylenchus destructor]|uniref:Transmembrane family of transporters domain-containing protein n=1 Tax=Ditylenchus destructor TaxID=166010 RepID=A0AAD4QV91_9BILA|nr:transmembrane family of transporters domain-containing protein [Ditylenchus destructor]